MSCFKLSYRARSEYLGSAPNISNAGVKVHEKYKRFVEMVNNINKGEVKA